MDVTVEMHCSQCGSANYSLTGGTKPEALIHCNDCGREMGSVGALHDELLDRIVANEAAVLRRDVDLD